MSIQQQQKPHDDDALQVHCCSQADGMIVLYKTALLMAIASCTNRKKPFIMKREYRLIVLKLILYYSIIILTLIAHTSTSTANTHMETQASQQITVNSQAAAPSVTL